MKTLEEIEKDNQLIARCEKLIALEKIRKRKFDTRRKIELGGLVIKSGMGVYEKSVIIGSLRQIFELIRNDPSHEILFYHKGNLLLGK